MKSVYLLLLLYTGSVIAAPVSDYTEDSGVLREVLKYCDLYGYHEGGAIEYMTPEQLKSEIVQPVKDLKSFYHMEPINGEITPELLNLVRSPRCGKPDKEHHSSRTKRWSRLSYRRWTTYPVTVSFNNFLTSRNISSINQENILLDCLQMWGEASGLWFRYRRINEKLQTNIRVYFTRIDGPWRTIGLGKAPSSRGSHLKLDRSEEWKETFQHPGRGPSLRWAICHELGHNLGLGHSNKKQSMMYSVGNNLIDDKLSDDDLNGIRAIYGYNNNHHAVEGALLVPPRKNTLTKTSTTTKRPTTTRPPITRRPTTRRPTTRRPTTRRPTTRRPTTRRLTTRRPTTRRPTARRPATRRPTTRRLTTRRPTTRRPTIRRLTTRRPTTRRPTARRPATRRPTTRRPTTRRLTTRRPTTRRPTARRPATRRPTTRRPATRRPTTRRPTTRRSTARRPTTRQPTTGRPTTRRPTVRRTTTRRPTTIRRPTTRRPTTRRPTTQRTTYKQITMMSTTTKVYTGRKLHSTQQPQKKFKLQRVGMSFSEWWRKNKG